MAQKALVRAQQWSPDAQLVEISVELQQQQPLSFVSFLRPDQRRPDYGEVEFLFRHEAAGDHDHA